MHKKSKKAGVSRVKGEAGFVLDDVETNVFTVLGVQQKERSILHSCFLAKKTLSDVCHVEQRVRLVGYCSYSMIVGKTSGLAGVLFYSYTNRTSILPSCLTVLRETQEDLEVKDTFEPLFTFERLGLMMYPSSCGSLLVIPTCASNPKYLIPVN